LRNSLVGRRHPCYFIEAIVKALDVGTAYKPEKCEMSNPGEHREQPTKRNDS